MQVEELELLLQRKGAALRLYAAQWSAAPDDCLQEALLRLVQQDPPPQNPVPWMFRVVRNLAISELRASDRRRRREQLADQQRRRWFADEPASLDRDELEEALRALPPEHREAVVARVWGELSFEQLSQLADCSVSTAHRRYAAGIQTLRANLGVTSCPNSDQH